MFQRCFESVSRKCIGCLKCINSLPKKVCFVVVVWQLLQLPEQKEVLFSLSQCVMYDGGVIYADYLLVVISNGQ